MKYKIFMKMYDFFHDIADFFWQKSMGELQKRSDKYGKKSD